MTRKWRLLAWLAYTVGCYLVMIIGFDWLVSIPVSIIVGFVCGLINELIQIQIKIHPELYKKKEKIERINEGYEPTIDTTNPEPPK